MISHIHFIDMMCLSIINLFMRWAKNFTIIKLIPFSLVLLALCLTQIDIFLLFYFEYQSRRAISIITRDHTQQTYSVNWYDAMPREHFYVHCDDLIYFHECQCSGVRSSLTKNQLCRSSMPSHKFCLPIIYAIVEIFVFIQNTTGTIVHICNVDSSSMSFAHSLVKTHFAEREVLVPL